LSRPEKKRDQFSARKLFQMRSYGELHTQPRTFRCPSPVAYD
jgi:hypothetical protein